MLKCCPLRALPDDSRRAFQSVTAIFNKRLVALLFCVLYQRCQSRWFLALPATAGAGSAPCRALLLILDGLVLCSSPRHQRTGAAKTKCARSI